MAFEMQDQVLELIDYLTTKLEKTVSVLKGEYASLRAGRANPHILDKVSVDYYGTVTPINQMGNISVTDARCLTITLWDASMLKTVDKAIQEANIGINPTNDGKVLRLVFPELTEERRRELVKQVKELLFPIDKMDGDSLPVSAFMPHVDGQWELGAAAYEKRGVAVSVPTWDETKCIQCNNCAYVCPHATIRPFALTEEEAKNAPANAKIVDIKAG